MFCLRFWYAAGCFVLEKRRDGDRELAARRNCSRVGAVYFDACCLETFFLCMYMRNVNLYRDDRLFDDVPNSPGDVFVSRNDRFQNTYEIYRLYYYKT